MGHKKMQGDISLQRHRMVKVLISTRFACRLVFRTKYLNSFAFFRYFLCMLRHEITNQHEACAPEPPNLWFYHCVLCSHLSHRPKSRPTQSCRPIQTCLKGHPYERVNKERHVYNPCSPETSVKGPQTFELQRQLQCLSLEPMSISLRSITSTMMPRRTSG